MLTDVQTYFSDAQAITATAVSTNVYDTLSVGDIGVGTAPWLVIYISTTFTSGNAGSNLTVTLQTDDNEAFSSAKTVMVLPSLVVASLTAGLQLANIPISMGCERYLRLNYTVGAANFTGGALTAFMSTEQAGVFRHYPTAYNMGYI